MDSTTLISLAKLVSISIALLQAGYGLKASQSSLPMLYAQPAAISTPMFAHVYYRGTEVIAPGIVVASAASAYLAYAVPEQRAVWATAGAMLFSIGPFTQLVMGGGIQRLIQVSGAPAAEQVKAQQSGEVRKLLEAWAAQNWVRVALNSGAGLLALWSVIEASAR